MELWKNEIRAALSDDLFVKPLVEVLIGYAESRWCLLVSGRSAGPNVTCHSRVLDWITRDHVKQWHELFIPFDTAPAHQLSIHDTQQVVWDEYGKPPLYVSIPGSPNPEARLYIQPSSRTCLPEPSATTVRARYGMVVVYNQLYRIGGMAMTGNWSTTSSDIDRFDSVTGDWNTIDRLSSDLADVSCASHGSFVYVFGNLVTNQKQLIRLTVDPDGSIRQEKLPVIGGLENVTNDIRSRTLLATSRALWLVVGDTILKLDLARMEWIFGEFTTVSGGSPLHRLSGNLLHLTGTIVQDRYLVVAGCNNRWRFYMRDLNNDAVVWTPLVDPFPLESRWIQSIHLDVFTQ